LSSDLLKYLDEKIRLLKQELEYYEELRKLAAGGGEAPSTPHMDLDSLPWRPYKDGNGEWLYRDEAPDDLATQLIQAGKPVRIGNYIYSMKSGTSGKTFISRRPAK